METSRAIVMGILFVGTLTLFSQPAVCAQDRKIPPLVQKPSSVYRTIAEKPGNEVFLPGGSADTKGVFAHAEGVRSSDGILTSGWLLQTVTTQNMTDTGWALGGMSSFTYVFDAIRNKTSTTQQISFGNGWTNSNLDSSTYDAEGRPTTFLELSWIGSAWAASYQDTFSYDANGYKTSTLERTWSGTAWANSKYDSYTNDPSGKPTVDVYQTWNGSTWVNSRRITYAYNANEQQTHIVLETWNNSAWGNYGQEFITYGTNGERSNVLQQAWQAGAWVNYIQDSYSYDASGRENLDVHQTWTSGAWVNFVQWISTYDANGNKSIYLEQQWNTSKSKWVDSEMWQYTWITAAPLAVLAPADGAKLLAGSTNTIQWHAWGFASLDIDLSLDSARSFHTIASGIPAITNSYEWQTPDTLSAKCRIRIRDVADSTKNAQSGLFKIKPYVFTRFKANGDYELYNPAIHGWQFRNWKGDMWPMSWWLPLRIIRGGIDPITGQTYNNDFLFETRGLTDSSFVDWPLFVRLFGRDSCYKSVARAVYSPLAVRLWNDFKDPGFMGSCFGFAVSSILAFEHPTELLQAFPEIGAFQNLHDLPLDSLRRRAVNELYEAQYGFPAWQETAWITNTYTVRMTLDELKGMLFSDLPAHRSLGMDDPRVGGHEVTPYRLQRDAATGLWNLYVYDCNCPSTDCHGVVRIDSLHNSWQYWSTNWTNLNVGLYVHPDPLKFLAVPSLWPEPEPDYQVRTTSLSPYRVLATSYARLFNSEGSITITNAAGETAGFHDSTTFNGLSDGVPIVPATGMFHRAIGYYVPSGVYTARMYAFADSTALFSACENSRMFTCWRAGADSSQVDLLTYNNGLAFGNPNVQTKSVNLECITKVGNTERVFQVRNCPAVHNDSLSITAPDVDRMTFVNRGPQKTYGLNIELADPNGMAQFTHTAITMPANSSHAIVPNWLDLSHQPVKIYEDIGNTGAIHDTLTLDNQIAGVEDQSTLGIPKEFRLEQNFPNPFNPTTIVRYQLPATSDVRLVVYDILGRQVAVLVNERKTPGRYEVRFDATGLSSGVYFYKITAGTFVETRRMVVVR